MTPLPPGIADRAAAILQDEIAHGALANVAQANQAPLARQMGRRVANELERFLDTLLDLLAPAVPELRSAHSVAPGQAAEILTRLWNDGPRPRQIDFRCSDLVTASGNRVPAGCVRLRPVPIYIPPGTAAELSIHLEVPADTRPGVYRGLLQARGMQDLRAQVTLAVGETRDWGSV